MKPTLQQLAASERTESDARALRALHLNKEKAWNAYWNAPVSHDGLTDDQIAENSMRRRGLRNAYEAALSAISAFERALKVAA